MVLDKSQFPKTDMSAGTNRSNIKASGGKPKMVVEISIKHIYKGEEYEATVTIDSGVDYAYFRALFDALLDKGYSFKIGLAKEVVQA
jgi:hypothetical protein